MVSDSELVGRLREFLSTSDLTTTTTPSNEEDKEGNDEEEEEEVDEEKEAAMASVPKKIKHKHKKVKLSVLQFYKVDDSGKVQRLRKECPNAECGAGTFMANHFDRHYCGKCGLTYVYQKAGGD
ncbi:Ribosomal protein S27a [Cynara cardunculus var. scolymus]|uniref:Ribosomal protein S27a n=1 Tax=Cynara cardunculus var. scolymus TaxID=59895 RepID=A0A103XF99_CYNCS|nr:Ribosomal protein S27a [Cynara cardunculus var. scolymus]